MVNVFTQDDGTLDEAIDFVMEGAMRVKNCRSQKKLEYFQWINNKVECSSFTDEEIGKE